MRVVKMEEEKKKKQKQKQKKSRKRNLIMIITIFLIVQYILIARMFHLLQYVPPIFQLVQCVPLPHIFHLQLPCIVPEFMIHTPIAAPSSDSMEKAFDIFPYQKDTIKPFRLDMLLR
ncbi:hypothetical protein GLYMA_14G051550v4 [Glycine max]|nr:hypothetical protein GYH30_039071 [Glycine max]KRH14831.2 hypothetical protein GLYMA_14G051550v4 [Glycine max]